MSSAEGNVDSLTVVVVNDFGITVLLSRSAVHTSRYLLAKETILYIVETTLRPNNTVICIHQKVDINTSQVKSRCL